jgi:prophage regulatory protein
VSNPTIKRFMCLPEVRTACGLAVSTIYDLIGQGKFPKAIKLGAKSVAWDEAEVAEWQAKRIAERDEGLKVKRKRAASAQRLTAH